MVTSASIVGSRADNQGHAEIGSEYVQFEDGIDVNDLGIFVFAAPTGDSDAEQKLVFKTADLKSSTQLTIDGSPGVYIVNMTILKDQLKEVLGFDIDPNSTKPITFRILMLANCSSPGTDAQAKWNEITATTFEGVIGQLAKWSYSMSYLYNAGGIDNVTALYGTNKKYMPMFGTNEFTVAQDDLYESRPDRRVYLGELDMLRALAKVRVIDNLPNDEATGYPKIIAASIIGTQDMARQLPYEAYNYKNGTQVHTPNIYDTTKDFTFTDANPVYRLGLISDQWATEPVESRTGSVRIGFVPEQPIAYLNNNAEGLGLPIFRISVARYKDDDGTDFVEVFDVPMTRYKNNQPFTFGDFILRNHIYTLRVDDITEVSLFCRVDVMPYVGVDLNPGFGFDDLLPRPPIQPGEQPPWTEFPNPNSSQP